VARRVATSKPTTAPRPGSPTLCDLVKYLAASSDPKVSSWAKRFHTPNNARVSK
jgi:hypothetical protein